MTNYVSSIKRWFDVERIEHSIKTAIACLIGFVMTKFIHVGVDQWLIITILVVMCAQINVGSMIQKSTMRFIGTLTGSLLAAATLILFGTNYIATSAMITFAAMVFSFVATSTKSYNESGTLGAATVVIILLGKNPDLLTVLERFLEISAGILIAALVSQFIFPIHARNHLRRNQRDTILMLRDFYEKNFLGSAPVETHQFLDEQISLSLIKQRKLANEAKQELFGEAFNIAHFRQSLWCEKEIMRSIIFMYHAYQASYAGNFPIARVDGLKDFHLSIYEVLDKIAQGIDQKKMPALVMPKIETLNSLLNETRQRESEQEKIALDTFSFCAGTLIARLKKLSELTDRI